MFRYLQLHEQFVIAALAGERGLISLSELKTFHEKQIRYMQHERLIHLIVTLFVATFLLLSIGFALVHPSWPGFAMAVLLLGLFSVYLVHYYRLENGVQRWYHLSNQIDERLGVVSQRYDDLSSPKEGA